jgi:hypothetical protein
MLTEYTSDIGYLMLDTGNLKLATGQHLTTDN